MNDMKCVEIYISDERVINVFEEIQAEIEALTKAVENNSAEFHRMADALENISSHNNE